MTLVKKVNGKRVPMEPAEEQAVRAEWQAKKPRTRKEVEAERTAHKKQAETVLLRVLPPGMSIDTFLDAIDTYRS